MPVPATMEQTIDAWLAKIGERPGCAVCTEQDRRIDLSPPPKQTRKRAGDKFEPFDLWQTIGSQPRRVEITCLTCGRVRVFDAGVMKL